MICLRSFIGLVGSKESIPVIMAKGLSELIASALRQLLSYSGAVKSTKGLISDLIPLWSFNDSFRKTKVLKHPNGKRHSLTFEGAVCHVNGNICISACFL